MVIAPPLQKRQAEWMERVSERLKQLEANVEGFKIENLKNNEQFISTVLTATQAANRNHQQEKREALRNAVLNVAVGSGLEQDAQAIFLSLIDRFTAWHLNSATVSESSGTRRGQKLRPDHYAIAGSRSAIAGMYYPDMQGQRQFYDIGVADLHAQGMLGVRDLQGMITGQGMFQKVTTDRDTYFWRSLCLRLGDLVLTEMPWLRCAELFALLCKGEAIFGRCKTF